MKQRLYLLAKQVDAAIKDIHISSIEEIEEILPFISQDLIVQLAWKAVNEGNYRHCAIYLPRSTAKNCSRGHKKNNGLHHIVPLAPFLEKDFLNTLAKKAIEKDGIKAISPIVHFLDKKYAVRVYERNNFYSRNRSK